MIAAAIAAVLSHWYLGLFVVAICTTIAKLRHFRLERKPVNGAYVFWGELLFYAVGISFVFVGIMHAYFQAFTAPSIGWQPSPFEYELGWLEIPVGIVALLSLWRGFEFRLAATIAYVTFSLAAAAQHIQQIVCCRNYAPDNAGIILWFGDIFLPIVMLVTAALAR